jgi:hypothetical protein
VTVAIPEIDRSILDILKEVDRRLGTRDLVILAVDDSEAVGEMEFRRDNVEGEETSHECETGGDTLEEIEGEGENVNLKASKVRGWEEGKDEQELRDKLEG